MSKNNIVVRLKQNNVTLETLVKPGTMKPYREGKSKIENVLVAEEVFINASKFQRAKSSDMKKCCKTDDKIECLKMILDNGTFPLSKNELQEMVEGKRKEIVNYIHKYYHDPRGEIAIPHPVSRIESTLNEMKVRIDPHEPVRQQLKPIIKKLPEVLPVKPMNPPSDQEYVHSADSGNSNNYNTGKSGKGKNKNDRGSRH